MPPAAGAGEPPAARGMEDQAAAGAATAMLPTSDEASYFFIRALPAGIQRMRVPESGLVWQAMPRCRPLTC